MSFVPRGRAARGGACQPHGMPELRPSSAYRRARTHPSTHGRGHLPRTVGQGRHTRSAGVRGPGGLPRTGARGAGQDRTPGGHRHRNGEHRHHPVCARRDGLRVPRREHGQRGRREALAQRRAGEWGRSAAGRRLHVGWRPHAGGHPEPHADGQDELRRGSDQRGDVTVRDDPRRPLHRRRGGELRHARRHLHRAARRAALLHRTARDPADHARGAAARFQHRRTQPRARPPRRRRPSCGPPCQGRQLPATPGRG